MVAQGQGNQCCTLGVIFERNKKKYEKTGRNRKHLKKWEDMESHQKATKRPLKGDCKVTKKIQKVTKRSQKGH